MAPSRYGPAPPAGFTLFLWHSLPRQAAGEVFPSRASRVVGPNAMAVKYLYDSTPYLIYSSRIAEAGLFNMWFHTS